jgi:hypothetical protein
MRHGVTFIMAMLTVGVIGLGAFFTIIGLATVVLGGPEMFASWLVFGLLVMAFGLIALGLVWRRAG